MPPKKLVPYTRLNVLSRTTTTEYASPKEFSFRVGAYGILEDKQGRLLMIKSFNNSLYDLPGGGIKPTESVREACAREFDEETGLAVEVHELLTMNESLFAFNNNPPFHAIRLYYRMTKKGGTLKLHGNDYDSFGCLWVPKKEIDKVNTIETVVEALHAINH